MSLFFFFISIHALLFFYETFKHNVVESNHRKSSWSTSDIPEMPFVVFCTPVGNGLMFHLGHF